MDVRIRNLATSIKDRWNSLDKNQKIKLSVATALILLTFIATLYMILKPNWVTLFSNSDVVTINNIQTALDDAGIVSTTSSDGRDLLVNEKDKVDAEVILMTETSTITSDQFTFTDALDLMSLGTTESVKSETLIRAKAGEIATALEAFDGVESATVELGSPEDDQFFLESADDATASVQLTLSKDIDANQAEAIARFVASSVVGLDTENVVVLDSKMNTLYSGDMESDVNHQYDIEAQKKAEIEQSVMEQLEPLYNEIQVTANIKFDWDNSVVNSTEYTAPNEDSPTVGIINSESTTEESVEGGASGSSPGTATNGGTEIYASEGDTSSADASTSDIDYSVNETHTTTEKTGGTIDYDNSSLSVMVYNYVYYDEQSMENNGELEDVTWDEFKQQTIPTTLEVDDDIVSSVVTATGIENVTVTGREVPTFIDKVETPPQVREIIMFIVLGILIALLAILILRNTRVEEVEEVEPELSVEDLLVSTKVEEISEVQEAESIKIKEENNMKTQIDKFVTERPDAAAQLLRNWLNEDWE